MKTYTGKFLQACMAMFFIPTSCALFAQNSYDFSATSGSFTELTGETLISFDNMDDAVSDVIPIGFAFSYFGTDYTEVRVSTNGVILMNTSSTFPYTNNDMWWTFDPVIAPLWDDMGGFEGEASYKTEGTPGNQIFTVEYLNWNWRYYAIDPGISFQAKLYEGSNKIEFIYRQESGALEAPTASIGLVGEDYKAYSLSDASASPSLHPGYEEIASKPATGQIYTFTPGAAPTGPSSQPSLSATDIEATSLTLSWTGGDGENTVVFMKQTSSTTDEFGIADGDRYVSSSEFGDSFAGDDWYCVYNGSGSEVEITGLQSGYEYRIQAFEYNGLAGNQVYLTTTSANNPINVITDLVAPTGPESTIEILYLGMDVATINIDEGDGGMRAVFVKQGGLDVLPIADNTTYSPDSNFGDGEQVGTSGWYCVENAANINAFDITGLTPGQAYTIAVVDYNGPSGGELYNTATFDNILVEMYPDESIEYTFAKSTGTFTELSGATNLDDIEWDDAISSSIPIGFDFEIEGQTFSTVRASSNGFLTLNPNLPAFTSSGSFDNLLNSNFNPVLAPLWDDLSGSAGQASYKTEGSAGKRIFTIEFKNWKWDYSASGTTISFQVKLYETTNKIEYIYRRESGAVNAGSAAIGVAFINKGNFLSLDNASSSATASNAIIESDINEKPATGQIFKFLPPKIAQTITFDSPPASVDAGEELELTATSTSGLPITFTSSDPDIAEISGNMLTGLLAGTITITASQPGDESYLAATAVDHDIEILKANQEITFGTIANMMVGEERELTATSTSGLSVSYESSNENVATISGNTLVAVGLGTCTITASQAGNDGFNTATSVERSLTVVKADQEITFTELGSVLLGAEFDLTATASSGLGVTYESSDETIATISGSTVTAVGVGQCTITASQAGNDSYNPAGDVVRTLTVAQQTQTITFSLGNDAFKTYGDDDFSVTAIASSGLTVTFNSSNEEVATVSGNTITVVAPGTTEITAMQSGDDSYAAAPNVIQTLTVDKADQEISIEPVTPKQVGDVFELNASSTSGLIVTFSTDDDDVVSIIGSTVAVLSGGSATIIASQSGNAFYNAAGDKEISFVIMKDQVITFASIPDKNVNDNDFVITAEASSELPITFLALTDNISLDEEKVTILAPGEARIRAQQAGNDEFNAADPIDQTFCITPAKPVITVNDGSGLPVLISSASSGNLWFIDDVSTGSTGSTIQTTVTGTYTVQVTIDGCESVMSNGYELLITDIEDPGSVFGMYPNPVEDKFIVNVSQLHLDKPAQIMFIDLSGKILNEWSGTEMIRCDISMHKAGDYLVKVNAGSRTFSKKIVKK